MYDVSYNRNTVGMNLLDYDDSVPKGIFRILQEKYQKSFTNGVSYRVTENPKNVSNFKEIYFYTMDRNQATEY